MATMEDYFTNTDLSFPTGDEDKDFDEAIYWLNDIILERLEDFDLEIACRYIAEHFGIQWQWLYNLHMKALQRKAKVERREKEIKDWEDRNR